MKNSHLRKLNNMKKRPIKLRESDIMNIVKRVIRERENIPYPIPDEPGPPENPGRPDRGPKRPGGSNTSALTDRIMGIPPNQWPEEVKKPFTQWWNDNVSAFMDLVMVDFDQFINDNLEEGLRRTNKRPIRRNRRR